jgi:hypothetical protein
MAVVPLIFFYAFEKKFINKINWYNVVAGIFFLSVILFIFLRFDMLMPYFDNVYSKFGAFRLYEILYGKREYFFSNYFYIILTFASSFGACILFFCFCEKWKLIFENNILKIYIIITAIFTAVSLWLFAYFSDRYILPVFFTVFLLMGFIVEKKTILQKLNFITIFLCTLFLLFNIAVSILVSQDMFVWSDKRWSLAEKFIKEKKLSVFELDGGHEWEWMHSLNLIKNKNENGFVSQAEIDRKGRKKYRIVFGSDSQSLLKLEFKSYFRKGEISVIKIK